MKTYKCIKHPNPLNIPKDVSIVVFKDKIFPILTKCQFGIQVPVSTITNVLKEFFQEDADVHFTEIPQLAEMHLQMENILINAKKTVKQVEKDLKEFWKIVAVSEKTISAIVEKTVDTPTVI